MKRAILPQPSISPYNPPLPHRIVRQRLSRRHLLGLGGAAAGSALLAGCDFSDAFIDNDQLSQPRKGDVEVVYWHMWTADWKKLIDSIVDQFNQSHPGIFVKALSVTGEATAKFLAARAGGDPPDVMTQWNQVIASWAHMGAIRALDDFPNAQAIQDWMYPSVVRIGTYEDSFFALPFSMNSFRLYLNKDQVTEAGGDPAKPPVHTEELDAIQDAIWRFDDRGFIERIGFMPATVHNWSAPFAGQWADDHGNPTATYDNNVRTLEWFQSYAKRYDPDRVAAFNQSMTSNVNASWPFLTNRLGFAADGMWRLVDLQTYAPDVAYDIVDFPYPEGYGKPQACWINGNFNVIPTESKHPDEAWEFITWLTGYGSEAAVAQLLIDGGWIPTSPKITEQPAYQAFMDEIPQRRGYVELFTSPNTQITPLLPAQQYYWDRLETAEERVLRLTMEPREALETVQDEIERELAKVQKQ